MQKNLRSKDMHHGELIRAGQARAREAGRVGGRPMLYSDAAISDAIRRHDAGETWAVIAASLGISEPQLYARVSKLREIERAIAT